ncbi:MAG: glycosyltransferase family 39 protein [Candidatus Omnitrophota bacterium]
MSRIDSFADSETLASSHREILGFSPGTWAIFIISLLIKLALIGLNQGEYTDGVIQLQLWDSPVVFFPPGYSAAAWLANLAVGDLLIAGKLVSILASIASLMVMYKLARRILENEREAFWAVMFLALSPIFDRWSLRMMTDSLFCLMFLVGCSILLTNEKPCPKHLLAWTGLASLVRYQGFFFLPFVFYLIVRKGLGGAAWRNLAGWAAALIPWVVMAWWIGIRGFGHFGQYAERASYSLWISLLLYYSWFEAFVLYWPWAVTYSLFILGVAGIWTLWRGGEKEKRFIQFAAFAAFAFLIAQSGFLSFQYRYLLPLVPLWCLASARGWTRLGQAIRSDKMRMVLGGLALLNLALMTAGVLYLQRATFGDLAQSARALQTVGKGSRVLSDEIYRNGVYNVKMRFWSGREMEYYFYNPIAESYIVKPQEGDIVVLHNTYSDLEAEYKRLSERFSLAVIGRWTHQPNEGSYMTIPLLPDIMVEPRTPLTSNPSCMAFRFQPQRYISVLLRLQKKLE